MNERPPMNDIPTRFGFPDTLPPLGRRELRSCFVFAGMGLLVLMLGVFPAFVRLLVPRCFYLSAICFWHADSISPELAAVTGPGLAQARAAKDYLVELGFDGEPLGQQADFRPLLPLRFRW